MTTADICCRSRDPDGPKPIPAEPEACAETGSQQPIESPKPEQQPKPIEQQPKQLMPDIPMPKPAPEAPPHRKHRRHR